jgi:hypothetical protein
MRGRNYSPHSKLPGIPPILDRLSADRKHAVVGEKSISPTMLAVSIVAWLSQHADFTDAMRSTMHLVFRIKG